MPLIKYNDFVLEYLEYGKGKEVLFAFPGFNREADDFRVFESSLGKRYRIVSFNLFFYGQSRINKSGNHPVHYRDLEGLMEVYLQQHNIKRFSLLGFSLGGRVALACLEIFSSRVDRVFLLAPDGIELSRWYRLLIRSRVGQRFSRYLVENPALFFKLADFLKKRGYISDRLYDFAVHHTYTLEKRQKLYNVWMAVRNIVPDIGNVRRIIRENNTLVYLVMGKYDSVIPVKIADKFRAGMEDKIILYIAPAGHNLVTYSTSNILNKLLHD
jgi:pimeloyl-ACP methyl ester carboxylesterase